MEDPWNFNLEAAFIHSLFTLVRQVGCILASSAWLPLLSKARYATLLPIYENTFFLFSYRLLMKLVHAPCYIHSWVRVRFKCKDTDPIVMNSFWFNSRCYYYKGGLWWWWCWSEGIFFYRRFSSSTKVQKYIIFV